ncbi:MAG: hypothetical protein ACI7YS_10810 [Flavobacterium sp.]
MNNSFQIFKSDNKNYHWNINNILFLLLIVMGFLKILNIDYISAFAEKVLIWTFIFGFIMTYINLFRTQPLYGTFEGILIFNSDRIIINDKRIEIYEIKKIFIRANDYEGKASKIKRGSLYPDISNGTNNVINLELKTGGKMIIFFKVNNEYQLHELTPFINSLIENKIVSPEYGDSFVQFDEF